MRSPTTRTSGSGAYPSTLNYQGFTKSICTSVNEVVCHGIGDDRHLRDGDIVNVDVTAYLDGMHGDTSATFIVGEASESVAALVDTCRDATMRGIRAVGADRSIDAIGRAIQPFAFSRGFGVVSDYGGHGIGRHFHAEPHIDHIVRPSRVQAVEGMVFTVEPMLTAGTIRHHQWDDGWTEVTDDFLPSAQFEHTVIVRDGVAQILTLDPAPTDLASSNSASTNSASSNAASTNAASTITARTDPAPAV